MHEDVEKTETWDSEAEVIERGEMGGRRRRRKAWEQWEVFDLLQWQGANPTTALSPLTTVKFLFNQSYFIFKFALLF